jgi:hypothetical protein
VPSDSLGLFFLGAIALSSLVQAALLVGFAIVTYRLAGRADALRAEMRPHLERVAEISANVEELSQAAVRQIPEIEATVQETAQRIRHAGEVAERIFVKPMAAGAMAFALFRAFRSVAGGSLFLKLRGR